MTSTEKDKSGNVRIKLEGGLTAYEVSEVKELLQRKLAENRGIILDISDLNNCDTLGIQLICSTGKTAAGTNKHFSLEGESQACREVAQNIGLELETYLNCYGGDLKCQK